MSAADVGVGGPSSPGSGMTLVARLQARLHVISARLRAGVTRLLDPDDNALAAWATAFARAPQAVPDLPPPPNKRLTRYIVGFVLGGHVALLLALYWRSTPPPPPPTEMTVELVREMPEQPKPKPPQAKPEQKPQQMPVQEGKSAEHKETTQQQTKQEQQTKSEQHQARQDPKPEAHQPKPVHQRQAHRAPPKEQKAQEAQKQAQEQPKQEQPKQEQPKQQDAQKQPTPSASQAQHDTPPAMAAVALPGASGDGTDAVSYGQLVLSQVAKAKKQGRYMGVPGYAGVRFRVGEDGSLEMVKLVVSSGDANLDIEAEAMIRRAAPFPKPPPGGRRDYGITLVFAAQP